MKQYIKTCSVIVVIILFVLVVLYRINFPGWFSSNSDDWANFVTYVSGIISPIITVIGFVFVIITIKKNDISNEVNHYSRSIDNIEGKINQILDKPVYIKYTNRGTVFPNTIRSSLSCNSKDSEIITISDSIEMNQLNNQMMEIRSLRYLLIMLSKLCYKIIELDKANQEWINIYKIKYYEIVEYVFNDKAYYYAKLLTTKESEDPKRKLFNISQKNIKYLDFYKDKTYMEE